MAPNHGNQPPSSYPGIWKYPTNRDGVESPLEWLEAKKIDDNTEGLWRVHDKLYRLDEFVNKHPGGSEWISMTKGTDITESFETSHAINVKFVEQVLAKYYVKDAESPRISPYTFKEDGFYKILKQRVEPILKKTGTGPDLRVRLIIDGMFLTSIALAIAAGLTSCTMLIILSGLTLCFGTISSHNFVHLKNNWRKFYWDLSLLSSYEYRISHALSHHLFPNTVMDLEISLFETTLEFLPKKNKSFLQRNAGYLFINHWVYLNSFFTAFMVRWKRILLGMQKLRPENLLNVLQLVVLIVLTQSFVDGLKFWAIMHGVAGYTLQLIGLNAAHHHPDIFHDGDEARKNPDFGLCQLDAVRDRAGKAHENFFIIMITFGAHSLHHLFPTVCHSKLHHIKGAFEDLLKEFSEKFPALTQWELYLGSVHSLARMEGKRKSE